MIKKKILIFVNNEYSAFAMKAHIQKKSKIVDVIIEKRLGGNNSERVELIKRILSNKDTNKVLIINRPKSFNFFSKNSIFNFRKIKSNLIIKKKIVKKLCQNKIYIQNYDEILITNDLISKLVINNYSIKLSYFFHGWGDIIHLKKSNKFINILKKFLTLKVLNYYLVCPHKNINFYNIFNNIYDKKIFELPKLINIKIYKKNLFDFYKDIKIKKIIKPMIVSGVLVPKYITSQEARVALNYYIKKLDKYINRYKIKNVIVKPKLNYNRKHLKIFKEIFSIHHPSVKIYSIFQIFKKYISLEIVLIKNKPCYFFSTGTTAVHLLKIMKLTKEIKFINAYNFIKTTNHSFFSELDLAKKKNTKLIVNFMINKKI